MTPSHKLFLLWDNMLLYLSTLWTPNEPLWRRQWHPTPVLLPGKSHGWRSLVGCRPWGHKESDMTEWLHSHFSLSCIGEGNGNPLQCSCLENPRDGGAWWAAVYGVTQSQTRLKWLSGSSSNEPLRIESSITFLVTPSLNFLLHCHPTTGIHNYIILLLCYYYVL